MKSTKEIAELNAGFEARIREGRYARRGIKSRKFSGAMPSPAELATLAAALARTSSENPETLCATALNLWFASHETIALQQQCNEDYQQLEAAEKPWPEPPKNQAWPITLKTFCKIHWPGESEFTYAPRLRAWLESCWDGVPYATLKREPIDRTRFHHLQDAILPWYQKRKAAQISAVRSEAAKKRHRKARPQRGALKEIVQELDRA